MKKNKYEVTVSGRVKLGVALAMLIANIIVFNPLETTTLPAFLSMLIYTLLFVYLAVNGSNSRIAAWIADRKFFSTVFLMPSFVCAFYSGVYFAFTDGKDIVPATFAVLLTILSIPFAFVLMRIQGGIRRENTLTAFLVFPVAIFLVCQLFAKTALLVAGGASLLVVAICFVISFIEFSRDHKVDYSSQGDSASHGSYKARWDNHPMSDVKDNVIHLKGTIIVEYTGDFYQPSADSAVENLIGNYVHKVGRDMPNYSVDKASVNIKYDKRD